MPAIDLGAAAPVSWALGTAGATVALAVTQPDGSLASPAPTVTESPSGTYLATVATPQAGRYLLSWSKVAAPAAAYTDLLDVWPADPRFIVPLAEMIAAIRSTPNATPVTDQNEMRLFLAAATPVIEDIVGAVLVRNETQTSDGGKSGIALNERPTAVTSVTVGGSAKVVNVDYIVDYNAAIIYAGSSTAPSWFDPGRLNVVINYTVGNVVVKPNIRLATTELVRHMWQWGRQSRGASIPGEPLPAMTSTPSGFLVPHRVMGLCQPDIRKDGV